MARLSAARSGTPLERELAAFEAAIARIAPSDVRFDTHAHPAAWVARVADEWRARMAFEHRSSMVFTQLATQLFEANAPLDTTLLMLRMAQDELRHTGTCARVVEALDGVPAEVEIDLHLEPLARHAGVSPEERALRNVLYTTCLSEMVACARFVATLDTLTDPFLRDATRALLADEVLHAQFGFHYLTWARPWLDAHPDAQRSLERYLGHAFAVLEAELAPRGSFPALPPEARALGANDPAQARDVFYATIEGAVVPGLERLGLAASFAWRTRARLDAPLTPPADSAAG